MATKNISITEEAYRRLASLRTGSESFSKIINRLTRRRNLSDFAGILSKESADRLEKSIRRIREAFKRDVLRRLDQGQEAVD